MNLNENEWPLHIDTLIPYQTPLHTSKADYLLRMIFLVVKMYLIIAYIDGNGHCDEDGTLCVHHIYVYIVTHH